MATYTYEQLVDLAEGRLDAGEAARLRALIAADPAAAAELAALTDLIDLMRSDDSVDAPAHVIARAVRLMRPPPVAPAPGAGLLQRIVAVLRGDSRQQPLAAGLRSGQAVRSLTYSAEAWDLDLQLTPQAGRWQLHGQLLGPELAGVVELSAGAEPLAATINELGEFSLPPVAPGAYTLRLRLGTHEILVAPLELGP
jgi:anti-sigma factor RsiW